MAVYTCHVGSKWSQNKSCENCAREKGKRSHINRMYFACMTCGHSFPDTLSKRDITVATQGSPSDLIVEPMNHVHQFLPTSVTAHTLCKYKIQVTLFLTCVILLQLAGDFVQFFSDLFETFIFLFILLTFNY